MSNDIPIDSRIGIEKEEIVCGVEKRNIPTSIAVNSISKIERNCPIIGVYVLC